MPLRAGRHGRPDDDVVTVERGRRSGDTWYFDYPFNRYYLPEEAAPLAEKLYNRANRRGWSGEENGKTDTYVAVRVRNGVGVIEELYIGGKPVREAVRAELEKE